MRLFKAAAFAAALLLCACTTRDPATGTVTVTTNPFLTAVNQFMNRISQFTVADLTWAASDAKAKGDVVSEPCWDFLLAQAQSGPLTPGNLPPLGVASLIQAARDGLSIGSGIPPKFQAACGALILDTQVRLAQAGILGAGVIATGGALAPAAGVAGAGVSASIGAAGAALSHVP
jgi:hypothetical protein